ncbi:MAG: GIY-YIG nuclease family protein [Candidatus Methanomethylicota archaeon]|uniref:GIY-YIG nuclease family protein n=1 Tax=Thermoproteota archaeon TaxID=2056631 RepID=A0A497F0R1_9CREN|nr:MAG: GIY-YIG nuclease family protein [Candidatus Verstraetearchaeota archaeon]
MNMDIGKVPGTYVLILEVKSPLIKDVGVLGELYFKPGVYAYAGSALGPGGLLGRISRHVNKSKRVKWHIDYLTTDGRVDVKAIVYTETYLKHECCLAKNLAEYGEVVKGFGSTDCKQGCIGHLVYFGEQDARSVVKITCDVFTLCELNPSVLWL